MWQDYIHQAISELYDVTETSPAFDYIWMNSDNGPFMHYWNEDKLGQLDMEAIQERCEEISIRKIVPKEISKAQALQALDDAGLYESVVATISNHDVRRVKIWFDSANYWERYHPYIQMFGPEFDLTEEQIDDLFIAASKL
jgi:hypothetical protein